MDYNVDQWTYNRKIHQQDSGAHANYVLATASEKGNKLKTANILISFNVE